MFMRGLELHWDFHMSRKRQILIWGDRSTSSTHVVSAITAASVSEVDVILAVVLANKDLIDFDDLQEKSSSRLSEDVIRAQEDPIVLNPFQANAHPSSKGLVFARELSFPSSSPAAIANMENHSFIEGSIPQVATLTETLLPAATFDAGH